MMAVACAAFSRRWIDDPQFISAAPSVSQWLAHLLLLQDALGYESLSTGVWYGISEDLMKLRRRNSSGPSFNSRAAWSMILSTR